MANIKKGLTNAASLGLSAAPTANPWVIGGASLLGLGTGLVSPERTFDPSGLRQAFKGYEQGLRSSARRSAAEAGSQIGTGLAAQGLSNSPLGQGIIAGQRRLGLQRAEDQINTARSSLEADIATAQEQIRQANENEFRNDLTGVSEAGLALTDNVLTQNSPLREKLGLPKIESSADQLLRNIFGTSPQAAAQAVPKLNYNSSAADIKKKLLVRGIKENSKYGQAHKFNPQRMQELEDALGSDFLDHIFGDQ